MQILWKMSSKPESLLVQSETFVLDSQEIQSRSVESKHFISLETFSKKLKVGKRRASISCETLLKTENLQTGKVPEFLQTSKLPS